MDFITHLPSSHGFTVILVIVDRYSKAAHFGALPTNFSAFKVASLFLDLVCKHHGFPTSIVSDRDPIFLSSFWRELFRLSGTRFRMSTAYHPESDGQTEVMNRVLEQYLRAFTHSQPSSWFRFLSLAEWSYNTSLHSSSKLTPFEVVYGKAPPSVPHYIPGMTNNEAVKSLISSRQQLHTKLQHRLRKAQETMKHYADAKREDITFAVGQWVYVKLKPFRQRSARGHNTRNYPNVFSGLSRSPHGLVRLPIVFSYRKNHVSTPSSTVPCYAPITDLRHLLRTHGPFPSLVRNPCRNLYAF